MPMIAFRERELESGHSWLPEQITALTSTISLSKLQPIWNKLVRLTSKVLLTKLKHELTSKSIRKYADLWQTLESA